jgi:hypothetical protein
MTPLGSTGCCTAESIAYARLEVLNTISNLRMTHLKTRSIYALIQRNGHRVHASKRCAAPLKNLAQ